MRCVCLQNRLIVGGAVRWVSVLIDFNLSEWWHAHTHTNATKFKKKRRAQNQCADNHVCVYSIDSLKQQQQRTNSPEFRNDDVCANDDKQINSEHFAAFVFDQNRQLLFFFNFYTERNRKKERANWNDSCCDSFFVFISISKRFDKFTWLAFICKMRAFLKMV